MEIVTINLSELYGIEGNATLKCFLHKTTGEMAPYNQNLPAMIVVPGGGYGFVSEREGDPIAVDFFNRHYNAYVLTYSIAPDYRYPTALTQLAAAVDWVKSNAQEHNTDASKVYAVGFSAGGHLVASLANFCDNLPVPELKGKRLDARPAAVVLSYPVIYVDSHLGSFKNLFGTEDLTRHEVQSQSLERSVTVKNPPTFIWTTAKDTCVNPMATVIYTAELLKNKVRVESHIFADGEHGAACCDERTGLYAHQILPEAKSWMYFADKFLKGLK